MYYEEGKRVNQLRKLKPIHERMVDYIIAHPRTTHVQIAKHFGWNRTWCNTIINSDLFQAALEKKREKIIDPLLRGSIEGSFKDLVTASIGIVKERLNKKVSFDEALRVLHLASKGLGYGLKQSTTVNMIGQSNLIAVLSSMQPPEIKGVEKLVESPAVIEAKEVVAVTELVKSVEEKMAA